MKYRLYHGKYLVTRTMALPILSRPTPPVLEDESGQFVSRFVVLRQFNEIHHLLLYSHAAGCLIIGCNQLQLRDHLAAECRRGSYPHYV